MKIRLNVVGAILLLIVVASLACSPSIVLQGLIGDAATQAPTRFAIAVNPESTSTVIPTDTSTPTSIPTVNLMTDATATVMLTNTPAPLLPLRTDLPDMTLRDWPRPANDNGRCIHFLPSGYFSARDFEIQIPRMKDLQMRWVLAIYSDENQLKLAAPQFKAAGITPIWRRFLRAYQRYYAWDRDIQILKDNGLPPYFQLYNEPDNPDEWDGRDVNRDQWVAYFVNSAKDIYNAGGYVGLQVLDVDWLRAVIDAVKAQQGDRLFKRMFFVPHPYGANHPPDYTQDEIGVLGFRIFADVFQQEIGFVPPFIAGEGGWKYKSAEDNRYPPIDDKLHAQYHVALFRWFLDGKLSDGSPLPDYLFAFCPWILAGATEGAAWYDSFEGERTLTISQVKQIPIFTRKFSWDKK